jgi:hypothetical protein
MTNPKNLAALRSLMEEDRATKICLIEDIMKASQLLAAAENNLSDRSITDQSGMFDDLYDQSINDLQITEALIHVRLNRIMRKKFEELMSIAKIKGEGEE